MYPILTFKVLYCLMADSKDVKMGCCCCWTQRKKMAHLEKPFFPAVVLSKREKGIFWLSFCINSSYNHFFFLPHCALENIKRTSPSLFRQKRAILEGDWEVKILQQGHSLGAVYFAALRREIEKWKYSSKVMALARFISPLSGGRLRSEKGHGVSSKLRAPLYALNKCYIIYNI